MIGTWIDYSQGTVSGASLEHANIVGAIRYVGIGGTGKRLTRAEYADHCAYGRETVAIVEQLTIDADGGYNAGVTNAKATLADLTLMTAGITPIQYVLAANDKPTYTQSDVDYVRAFRDILTPAGYIVGPYGFGSFLAACSAAGLAPVAWQAGPAPSRTGTAAIATWWQRNGGPVAASDGPGYPTTTVLDGVTCDLSNQLLEVPMTAPTPGDYANAVVTALVNFRVGGRNLWDFGVQTVANTDPVNVWEGCTIPTKDATPVQITPSDLLGWTGANVAATLAAVNAISASLSSDEAALLAAIKAVPPTAVDPTAVATALTAAGLPTQVAQTLLAVLAKAATPTS